MFNDFKGFDNNGTPVKIAIPPTLLISSISVIDEIIKVVSFEVKLPGDFVYILGETYDELGGSEYYSMKLPKGQLPESYKNKMTLIDNYSIFNVPNINTSKNKKLYLSLHKAINKQLISSSISITRGGLGIALAKKAIGGNLGLTISLNKLPGAITHDEFALYSESQGRILITVAKENKVKFEKLMQGISFKHIGNVTKEKKLTINGLKGNEIINLNIEKMTESYRKTFKYY